MTNPTTDGGSSELGLVEIRNGVRALIRGLVLAQILESLLQRLVIHEQHGGQKATVRCIDDCLLRGQSRFTGTAAARRPCYLDT